MYNSEFDQRQSIVWIIIINKCKLFGQSSLTKLIRKKEKNDKIKLQPTFKWKVSNNLTKSDVSLTILNLELFFNNNHIKNTKYNV